MISLKHLKKTFRVADLLYPNLFNTFLQMFFGLMSVNHCNIKTAMP